MSLFFLIKQCIPIKSYILFSFMENVENRATEYYRTFSCVTHKKRDKIKSTFVCYSKKSGNK